MNSHQLAYVRHLLRKIKDLYIEKEAMAVLLDTGTGRVTRSGDPWRVVVQRMQQDPVYRSAVEANLAPRLLRMEQALQDERLLKQLEGAVN
jgi:hypothetical protein